MNCALMTAVHSWSLEFLVLRNVSERQNAIPWDSTSYEIQCPSRQPHRILCQYLKQAQHHCKGWLFSHSVSWKTKLAFWQWRVVYVLLIASLCPAHFLQPWIVFNFESIATVTSAVHLSTKVEWPSNNESEDLVKSNGVISNSSTFRTQPISH